MTTEKQRFSLNDARQVADLWLNALSVFTERMVIAGSVRRERPDVGDIELLYIPMPTTTNLFGEPEGDALSDFLVGLIEAGVLEKRVSALGNTAYGPKNKMLRDAASGIPMDIFATTPENWGMSLVIRTGPADFNIRLMSRFKELGLEGHAYGGITQRDDGSGITHGFDCPDEETVFRLAQLEYLPPRMRA